MKRYLLLLLPLIVFLWVTPQTFAQIATDSAQPAATASSSIQYDLPYPGILPDNPLYMLKALRDRVVGMLIADPSKKSQFYLLNSDKRVWAGMMLFDKKEYKLGLTTISKSNNYMHDAATGLDSLLHTRKDLGGDRMKMLTSMKKHQELIRDMIHTSPKQYHASLQYELRRLDGFEKILQKYQA